MIEKRDLFYIGGIHCAACEIIISETLAENSLIDSYSLSKKDNSLTVKFTDERLNNSPELAIAYLSKVFADTDYTFSTEKVSKSNFSLKYFLISLVLAIVLVIVFNWLGKQAVFIKMSNSDLNASASLWAFFGFGFIASISSCAVLVGGIILALSQYWQGEGKSKWLPLLSFQVGRIIAFGVFGFILGLIGQSFRINPRVNAVLLLLVAVFMFVSGLDLMGIKLWRPKVKNKLALELSKKKQLNYYWPALVGAATFFLPCGFTYTAQLAVLTASSPILGAKMLLAFVLGTVPVLTLIGVSGSWSKSKKGEGKSNVIQSVLLNLVAILIMIFALVNLNSQLMILNLPSVSWTLFSMDNQSDGKNNLAEKSISENVSIDENDVQVIKILADARGYTPTKIVIKEKTNSRLEIEDIGTRGCTNAIIAPDFFAGEIPLVNGETALKEFVSPQAGKYKITCWMGMTSIDAEVIK